MKNKYKINRICIINERNRVEGIGKEIYKNINHLLESVKKDKNTYQL